MHRFHLPPSECLGPTLTLTGAEAHHASDVLRVKPGEAVAVLDGEGRELDCTVAAASRKSVILTVKATQVSPTPAFRVTLVQAVPKGKLFDTIIQKATELGADCIIPLLSERVVTRLENDEAEQKREKWQQVAIEAIKQCGQRWLPKVESPLALPALLARRGNFHLSLVGALQPDSRHPSEYLRSIQSVKERPIMVRLWIGPEGDFTEGEYAAIRGAGAKPISLGPLILRSDTAAIYSLSIVSYEMQTSAVQS